MGFQIMSSLITEMYDDNTKSDDKEVFSGKEKFNIKGVNDLMGRLSYSFTNVRLSDCLTIGDR